MYRYSHNWDQTRCIHGSLTWKSARVDFEVQGELHVPVFLVYSIWYYIQISIGKHPLTVWSSWWHLLLLLQVFIHFISCRINKLLNLLLTTNRHLLVALLLARTNTHTHTHNLLWKIGSIRIEHVIHVNSVQIRDIWHVNVCKLSNLVGKEGWILIGSKHAAKWVIECCL